MENYIEECEKQREGLLRRKGVLQEEIRKAREKYTQIEESDIDRKEVKLQVAQKKITRLEQNLLGLEEQLEFLRPANEDDIEYRKRQEKEFARKMKDLIPEELPLRFHGCPIYTAKHIIESGELSSSVDRLGYETSYDAEGQISVTTKDSLDITIYSYSKLYEDLNLPAGCVFVLLPEDERDAESGQSLLMNNVNFKENPDRLYGIITTPENIEKVQEWGEQNGINLDGKIYDYDGFAQSFEKEKALDEDDRIIGSAIEATELETRSGKINEQVQNMKNIQKSKEEPEKQTEEVSK